MIQKIISILNNNPLLQQNCSGCTSTPYLFFLVTTALDLNATLLSPGNSVGVWANWTDIGEFIYQPG